MERIVVVGAGQAGSQAADTLRRRGFAGSITIVGEERWPPYQRPPLSKKYLAGAMQRERLWLRAAEFFTNRRIELRLARRAEQIDRRNRRLYLDDGSALDYDRLLLTTGSRARKLPIAGVELPGVHYLRTIDDVERLKLDLTANHALVIIGGGYIGLEVAATAREAGMHVTVLEAADRIMSRVVCEQTSRFFESKHARCGVRVLPSTGVREIIGNKDTGRVAAVITEDGSAHAADVVLIGVGASAAQELAEEADLECADGIVVDGHCRTTDERIYAAGDCTNHPNGHYARRVRLESVDNAFEHATTAASNMIGTPVEHVRVPWFWSDQYDLKLTIVGLSDGYDCIVLRGDIGSESFSVCYLRDGELIALDAINRTPDYVAAKKLIQAHFRPNVRRLENPRLGLVECA